MMAKRGNVLWVPSPDHSIECSMMIVGFETAKIENKTVLSISATINSTFTLCFTSTKIYEGSENKFKAMQELLGQAIESYVRRNKEPPS